MDEIHVININDLVNSTKREDSVWSTGTTGEEETGKPLIRRINQHIRNKFEDVFLPYILSIGPYNHRIPATHAMQKTKYEYLDSIVNLKRGKGLPDYLRAMKQLEKQARSYYAGDISMHNNDFLKMLLLDGCFILISFKGIEASELQESNESNRGIEVSLDKNEVINVVGPRDESRHEVAEENSSPSDLLYIQNFWHDILLFENQIPFFVIKTIHELIAGESDTTSMLIENVMESLEGVLGCYPKAICNSSRPRHIHHLLHLCHLYFKPSLVEDGSDKHHLHSPLFHNLLQLGRNFLNASNEGLQTWPQTNPWRRATEYHQAGIDFKKKEFCSENPHSLLDIIFCNGVIEIPCLTIHPNTQSLFCNLIALEQTYSHFGTYVTSYIVFLSHLANMPDDVSFLTKRGIIEDQLHCDAEVSDLLRMTNECVVSDYNSDSYLKPLSDRLEAHFQNQRPILKEFLGSITSKVHGWTQKTENSGLPTAMSPAATPV